MSEAKVQQPDANVPPPDTDPDCPASDTGRAESCSEDKDQYDEASFTETYESLKVALAQKKNEFFALSDVVEAEASLVKKSFIVTAMSMLAAFTFGCCCWLVINFALGTALFYAGLSLLPISAILLVLNLAMAGFALKVARDAYKHITLMPMFEAMVGQAGLERDEQPGER